MIKTALKNFFGSIIYIFVPMGIIYLFVLFALFAFVLSFVGSAATMIGELSVLINDTALQTGSSVTDFVVYACKQLTWDGNIFHFIGQIVDTNWVEGTVREFLAILNVSSEAFTDSFLVVVREFTGSVKAAIGFSITLCVLGFVLANYATGFVVRRKNARRGLKKWVIANTVLPLVESIVLGGLAALTAVISYFAILVFVVTVFAYAFLALASSWIVYSEKKIPLKEVVTVRNMLSMLASMGVIILLVAILFVGIMILNFLLAVLVILPILLYALNIIKVNTDAYVIGLVAEKTEKGEHKHA